MKEALMKIVTRGTSTLIVIILIAAGIQLFASCSSKTEAETSSSRTVTGTISNQSSFGLAGGATTHAGTTSPSYSSPSPSTASGKSSPLYSGNTIGLSTGGAKDIINFRENIENNYLPLPTDVTYEGLFYDYYFDTGITRPCDKLFCPSYASAVTRDPLSGKPEYYLSVGLNSGLRERDFERKLLNLVIVLDVSDSMNAYFDQYYYDGSGNRINAYADEGVYRKTKIGCAKDAVVTILDQLDRGDHFAIVSFNTNARAIQSMGPVNQVNMSDTEDQVLNLFASGSTNLDAGMDLARAQFRGLTNLDSSEYENRIIVLTDAQPNTGYTSSTDFMTNVQMSAEKRIYTTFIGVGVDFNSQLIESITKVRGANYYSVHSQREFQRRMEEEFDFMVTPLIFNLQLKFESHGWRIDRVFGSPEADSATGSLMTINTLFPSKSEGGETKGGLVLLKLRRISSEPDERIYLRVSYEDRNGRRDTSESLVFLETQQPEYFENTGIRKGILLSRYAALLKNWMMDERQYLDDDDWYPRISEDTGIEIPSDYLGQWERQSLPLTVSEPYVRIFRNFSRYFRNEMEAIGDNSLEQELDILEILCNYR